MQGLLICAISIAAFAVAIRPRRRRSTVDRPPVDRPLGGMASDVVLVEPGDPSDVPPGVAEFDNQPPCETFSETGAHQGVEGAAGTETAYEGTPELGGACQPPWDLEPEQRTSAPFAEPGTGGSGADPSTAPLPLWPIDTKHAHKVRVSYRDVRGKWHGSWGYHLGSKRQGAKIDGVATRRHHAGVDLYARKGDIVLAAEAGEVIAMLPFHHSTWSVYVRNLDGKIVNYGELAKDSWTEFGLPLRIVEDETHAAVVEAGQPLGRIGVQTGGNTMLHFETYAPEITLAHIRAGKMRWEYGKTAPFGLLDPSKYLVAAQHTWFRRRKMPTA